MYRDVDELIRCTEEMRVGDQMTTDDYATDRQIDSDKAVANELVLQLSRLYAVV